MIKIKQSKNSSRSDHSSFIIDKGGTFSEGLLVYFGRNGLNGTTRTASLIGDIDKQISEYKVKLVIVVVYPNDKNIISDIEKFRINHPTVNVLIMSTDFDKELMLRMFGVGVFGYIPLISSEETIKQAVLTVREDEPYFPDLEEELMDQQTVIAKPVADELSEIDKEIMLMTLEGKQAKPIASALKNIGSRAVNSHIQSLMDLFNIHDKRLLAKHLKQNGMLDK